VLTVNGLQYLTGAEALIELLDDGCCEVPFREVVTPPWFEVTLDDRAEIADP
jgi:hypothetical protein